MNRNLEKLQYNSDDILRFFCEQGNINLDDVQNAMNKKQYQKIINEHPYKVAQGPDGRWHTRVKEECSGKSKTIIKNSLDELHDALVTIYADSDEFNYKANISLSGIFEDWINYKRLHNAAPSYISRLYSDWRTYYERTEIVEIPLCKLDKITLDEWAHTLIQKNNLTRKQYYNIATIMKNSLIFAEEKGIIFQSPFRKVKIDNKRMFPPTRKPPSETQVFTAEERKILYNIAMDEFLNPPKQLKHRLVPLAFILHFEAGPRISEMCTLRYSDVEAEDLNIQRFLRYQQHEIVPYTKGMHEGRAVPLTDKAKEIIQLTREYKGLASSDDGYIFSINDEPLSYYAIRKAFERYCRKAEIMFRSSHKARKTYISILIDADICVATVSEYAGHADEKTTLLNYHFDTHSSDEKREAVRRALKM